MLMFKKFANKKVCFELNNYANFFITNNRECSIINVQCAVIFPGQRNILSPG